MRAPPFSPAVLHEARLVTQPQSLWQRPQVQGVTIDAPESRDLDDAIWIEPTTDGGAIASIHISDVAEGIALGSPLDQCALERVVTQYYPGFNAPMLPRSLSEAAWSLLEGQRRATVTVRVELDALATVKQVHILETWLVSAHRFSYRGADGAIANPAAPYSELLKRCQFWAHRLYERRKASGAIGGMATATGNWIDENGQVSTSQSATYHSHQIIQEFMILANTVVAQWLAHQDIAALFRNHTAREFPPGQDHTLDQLQDLGLEDAVYRHLQHCLNRAEYSPHQVGHFALKLPAYCHFTSPIRRVADLINHRIVKAHLHHQPSPYHFAELETLGAYIVQVLTERVEATSDHFRAQRHQLYEIQLQDADTLTALSNKEFSRLVKYVVKSEAWSTIADEFYQRLISGQLLPQELYWVLFANAPHHLQTQVLDYLADQSHICQSVVTIAVNKEEDWQALTFLEHPLGQDFVAWLEVIQQGQRHTTSDPGMAPRKQAARHRACWLWLSALINGTLVTPEQRQLPPLPPAPAPVDIVPPAPNSIAALNMCCQQQGWPLPRYEFFPAEQGFDCQCHVQGPPDSWVERGTGTSKRAAKHQAAAKILDRLRQTAHKG